MALLIRLILVCLFSMLLFYGASFTHFIFNQTYDNFIDWLAKVLQKSNNWIPFFKARLTATAFHYIKMLIVIADIALLLLMAISIYRLKWLESAIGKFFFSCRRISSSYMRWLKTLPAFDRYAFYSITGFAFAKALWYSVAMPIQYDEAWTYNYYISNDLWQSLFLPSNNHKLFTFIAWWFNLLPFDKVFLIRLPNAITGVIVIAIFFRFVSKNFSSTVALIGLAWFATCVPLAIYMTLARSYVFVILFSLLLLIQYFSVTQTTQKSRNRVLLGSTIVLGYLSNPVFFFGHVIMSIYFSTQLLINRQFQKLQSLLAGTVVAVPVLLCFYITDIFGGHFSGLMQTAFKTGVNAGYFLDCIRFNADFQTGIENRYGIFVFLLIAGIFLCFSRNARPKTLLIYSILSICCLPFYATLVHDDTSRHKTIFITISVAFILMFIIQAANTKIRFNKYALIITSLFLITLNTINLPRHSWFVWSKVVDESVKQAGAVLIRNKATDCYIIPEYYKPGIEFYARINDKRIKLYMSELNSIDYDSSVFITKFPEFVLSDHRAKQVFDENEYRVIFSDPLMKLYQRKDAE